MSDEAVGRQRFEQAYRDAKAPWDIGLPQPSLVEVADQVNGSVLDVGCGTGENAMFFAARGHDVVGVDYLPSPIERAKKKARERALNVRFAVHDALQLSELRRQFDNVIDCGLFHVFSDEDRDTYVGQLETVTHPGSILFLLCFSDKEPGDAGPRRISRDDLKTAFSSNWRLASIDERRFHVRHDFDEIKFSEGGPIAWLAVAFRT